jgi:hypothetical protein
MVRSFVGKRQDRRNAARRRQRGMKERFSAKNRRLRLVAIGHVGSTTPFFNNDEEKRKYKCRPRNEYFYQII